MFQIPGYPLIQTTVGKLNFFRWAIEKGVLNYIKLNLPTIEAAMNASARELQKMRKALSASTNSSATSASSAISNATTVSTRSTTRKRLSSAAAAAVAAATGATHVQPTSKLMEKHDCTVEVRFD